MICAFCAYREYGIKKNKRVGERERGRGREGGRDGKREKAEKKKRFAAYGGKLRIFRVLSPFPTFGVCQTARSVTYFHFSQPLA